MSNLTKIIKVNPDIIEEEKLEYIAEEFRKGKIIVYPTETFYGLGTNPFNREAVKKIYYLKKREFGKPLPIIIHEKSQVEELAQDIHEVFYKIAERFWPGSLTIVLKAKSIFPDEMLGEEKIRRINEVLERFKDLSEDELIVILYSLYPEYARHSKIKEKVERIKKRVAIELYKKGKISLLLAARVSGLAPQEIEKYASEV